MHKTHTFLDGDALIELHEMLSDGYSHEQIGNKLNVHAQTVKNFDPANPKWRKDLFRIRTTSSKKFVTKGERKARNGNTHKKATLPAVIDNTQTLPKMGISKEASDYIHACALVFKKTPVVIMDEMVKACKKLRAVTIHEPK